MYYESQFPVYGRPDGWKPLVYICSPFSGDEETNAANARRYSRFAVDSGAIDGDYFAAFPGISHSGGFELFGDDEGYLRDMDGNATERAYRKARCARFEFGEQPTT